MPFVTLSSPAKLRGTRYPAGAEVEVSDDEHTTLLESGAVRTVPPPRPVIIRPRRSAEEKAEARREAQARLAQAEA